LCMQGLLHLLQEGLGFEHAAVYHRAEEQLGRCYMHEKRC
jgi:hypothetical protein